MLSQFGLGDSPAIQYLVAFVVILALLALFAFVLRRLTGGRLMLPGQDRGRSRQPRLGIVDIYDLDRQRQLILLRRDNVEHLLLIGGPNDVVIETNIVRVPQNRAAVPTAEAERAEPSLPQAPARPAVEPPARPVLEPAVSARLGPVGASRPADESDAEELAPVAALPPAPTPARAEPVLKPDAVTVTASASPPLSPASEPPRPAPPRAEPRLERPAPPRAARPEAPPAPPPAPARAPEPPAGPVPPRPPEPLRAAPPVPPRPPEPPPAAPVPPRPPEPPSPAAPRVPDATILSDMARQLEQALRRPTAPVDTPTPRPPEPRPTPAPVVPPSATSAPGPRADVPAGPVPRPPTLPPLPAAPPVRPAPARDREAPPVPPVAPSAPDRAAGAEPVRGEPARPVPAPRSPEPAPTPRPPEPTPRAPEPAPPAAGTAPKRGEPDPFSVEDIEAEFARLLGRPTDRS